MDSAVSPTSHDLHRAKEVAFFAGKNQYSSLSLPTRLANHIDRSDHGSIFAPTSPHAHNVILRPADDERSEDRAEQKDLLTKIACPQPRRDHLSSPLSNLLAAFDGMLRLTVSALRESHRSLPKAE